MAGCGYVCPVCEGKGFDENLDTCSWCQKNMEQKSKIKEQELEDWINSVHEGPCCSHPDEEE